MGSVFTKIINREIPAYIVAENEHCIAFLDIRPLQKGHTLVVPKMETDKLFDLPEDVYKELWLFARKVSVALEKSVDCNRIGVTVYGLEVPHAHIHLIPIKREGDMDFRNPLPVTEEQFFEKMADTIKQNLK
jgi:histidine triad (HIT) family protein